MIGDWIGDNLLEASGNLDASGMHAGGWQGSAGQGAAAIVDNNVNTIQALLFLSLFLLVCCIVVG